MPPPDNHPRRIALWLEYQGDHYHGFQSQLNQPTIQGTLETALTRFTAERIRTRAASRTDVGAHALGQVVDFQTASRHPPERFPAALNYYLPDDIRVLQAIPAPDGFHSRRSAAARVYHYQILARPAPTALRRRTHLWVRQPLDANRMAEAAQALTGTHDFRVIAPSHPKDRSASRTVTRWEIRREADTLIIQSEANGFLKHQIRKINAILLEIAKGNHPVDLMRRILAGAAAPPNIPPLPARGLCLIEVKYPAGTFNFPPAIPDKNE